MSPFGIDFMSESSRAPTAWIMSKGLAIRLPAYRDCKVVMLPQTFLPLPASFAYPKNSSLAIIIDYQFGKLQETGVQTRIEKKYTPLAPECRHGLRAYVVYSMHIQVNFSEMVLTLRGRQ